MHRSPPSSPRTDTRLPYTTLFRSLHAHPARQGRRVIILETRGIDDGEFQAEQLAVALAAVARHPRLVVDEREPLADEPVEQRRLAHLGQPDNGHRRVSRPPHFPFSLLSERARVGKECFSKVRYW